MNYLIFFAMFTFGFTVGVPTSFREKSFENSSVTISTQSQLPVSVMLEKFNSSLFSEEQDRQLKVAVDLIGDVDDHNDTHYTNFIQVGSIQEIQTIKDYLLQLKTDVRSGASSYVQDSVAMMEELTTAIKGLKNKIEVTVNRVNSKAESKLLTIKAIEELIGFSVISPKKSFVADKTQSMVESTLLEIGSVQEIQTIKDYLEQLKSDIRSGVASYVQDSISMMGELTTAIKNLKKKIEATVNRVNSKAESKLLAIKAIEELIGFSGFTDKKSGQSAKSLVQYEKAPTDLEFNNRSVATPSND